MKFYEIGERVKSGEITLDPCGHQINTRYGFIERFNDLIADAAGANDGKWKERDGKTVEELNLEMRQFYQQILDREYEENDVVGFRTDGERCFGCGENLRWVFNGNKLTLRDFYNPNKERNRPSFGSKFGDFDLYPLDFRCPYENPKPFSGEIKIESRLIFANFFRDIEDCPDDTKRYSEEWSLNYLRGRDNITKHKCSRNVAYGQMGNMSIGIYVHKNKDSVIVGPSSHPIEWEDCSGMTDEEYEAALDKPVFEGFEMVGSIILDVWRWEATDLKTIGEENYSKLVEDHQYRGLVELDVKHGIWKFEHYYDRIEDDRNNHCYSKFVLKESA